jgi:hypothetical protein
MVDVGEVDFTKAGYEPSPAIGDFRKWLKESCGIDKPRKPDVVVRKAKAEHGARFDAWKKKFFDPE